nr:interleukin-1 receptor-associated kinase 1-binding protein 1 isoform X5 [Manis javanica]
MRRTHDATELRNEVLFILLEEFWKDFIVEVTNLKQWLKGEPCSLTRVQQAEDVTVMKDSRRVENAYHVEAESLRSFSTHQSALSTYACPDFLSHGCHHATTLLTEALTPTQGELLLEL